MHYARNGFLTAKGLSETALRSLEGLEVLAVETPFLYLDKVGSVSGLRRDEIDMIFDDGVINEQFERYSQSTRELS